MVGDLAVVDVVPGEGFVVTELAPDGTREALQRVTGAPRRFHPDLKPYAEPVRA